MTGEGTPTELADGFGARGCPYASASANYDALRQNSLYAIHPTGWVPRAISRLGVGSRRN